MLLFALSVPLFAACSRSGGEPDGGEPLPREVDNTGNNYAVITIRDFGIITVKLYPEYAPIAVHRFSENAKSGYYEGKTFHRIVANFMAQGGAYEGRGMEPLDPTPIRAEIHPEMRHFYGALSMAATSAGDASDSFYIVNNKNTDAFTNATKEQNIANYNQRLANANLALADISENYDAYVAAHGKLTVDFSADTHRNTVRHMTALIDLIENATAEVKTRYNESGGTPFLDGGYTVFGYMIDGFDVLDAVSAVEVAVNSGGEMSMPIREVFIDGIEIKENI
jgi:cyclophilin family peptidyl-prolyl cis-trans isomerase